MITVFYDGKCGLCRREIAHYKRIAPAGIFSWIDITVDKKALEKIGIRYADGLKLLHATDANGTVHAGVDVFLLIWKNIPRWRIVATLVGSPVIRPLANHTYRMFAAWRFNRLSHCQLAQKEDGDI